MKSRGHHVPERTCIACRQTRPKEDLIRLVHSVDGNIKLDQKGGESGRGAYLCKVKECWELALARGRKDRLAQALRTGITLENRKVLSEYGKTLPSAEAMEERGIG